MGLKEGVINSGQEIKIGFRNDGLHDILNSAAVLVYHLKILVILNVLQEYLVHLIKCCVLRNMAPVRNGEVNCLHTADVLSSKVLHASYCITLFLDYLTIH
jgi:hypothetical protein